MTKTFHQTQLTPKKTHVGVKAEHEQHELACLEETNHPRLCAAKKLPRGNGGRGFRQLVFPHGSGIAEILWLL